MLTQSMKLSAVLTSPFLLLLLFLPSSISFDKIMFFIILDNPERVAAGEIHDEKGTFSLFSLDLVLVMKFPIILSQLPLRINQDRLTLAVTRKARKVSS